VTVGSEGVLLEDMVVRKMGTVVGNPPTVFANYRDQDFLGMLESFYFTFFPFDEILTFVQLNNCISLI
jgi:hypothetical protein